MPITKLGEEMLRDYQQRVLDKLKNPDLPGLVAYHSTGAGKTLTALKALQEANERTNKPGLFIVPASLVDNAKKEILKHNLPLNKDNLDISSYESATKHIADLLETPRSMVVFDEAHRLRNAGTARVRALKRLIRKADKTLMLTGTAGYNSPADIPALVKMINPKSQVPITPKEFALAYVDEASGKLKDKESLKQALAPYVDVYQRPMDSKDFPSITERIERVPMSDKQEKLYKFLEKNYLCT